MAAILDQLRASFEGAIDFEGQRKAEYYTNIILPSSAVLAFILGLILQDLRITLATYGIGFLFALLVVIPPWNMYRQHPVKWLPVQEETEGQDGPDKSGTSISSTSDSKKKKR